MLVDVKGKKAGVHRSVLYLKIIVYKTADQLKPH